MTKKLCCISFWSCWPKECNGAIDNINGIIPLLMSMVSDDQESHVASSWCKEWSGSTDDVVGTMWHWCQCQWHQMSKMSCCISFCLSWCKECSGANFDASGIIYSSTSANGITWPKRSCCTSFQSSWLKWCNGAIGKTIGMIPMLMPMASCNKSHVASHVDHPDLTNVIVIDKGISITWCPCQHQVHHITGKVMLHLFLIILTKQMHWHHWSCQRNHMTLMLVPVTSHEQNHVTSPFDCLDLTDGMVPLITLGIMWHWHQHQWHHLTQNGMLHIVSVIPPDEYSGAIDNAIGITWCWCQCQQCQMIEKTHFTSHFDHLELTQMQWCYWWCHQCHVISTLVSKWPKMSQSTLFQSSWPRKQNGAIDNAICVMWCSLWCETETDDQRSHAILCFNCLHVMKMMLL